MTGSQACTVKRNFFEFELSDEKRRKEQEMVRKWALAIISPYYLRRHGCLSNWYVYTEGFSEYWSHKPPRKEHPGELLPFPLTQLGNGKVAPSLVVSLDELIRTCLYSHLGMRKELWVKLLTLEFSIHPNLDRHHSSWYMYMRVIWL